MQISCGRREGYFAEINMSVNFVEVDAHECKTFCERGGDVQICGGGVGAGNFNSLPRYSSVPSDL